jgi:hypothetical protein
MKLGIRLITNIKYAVIFVVFLWTMIVFSYQSPGDDSVGNEPAYAYQQASNEPVLSAQLPPKSMAVKITSPAENQNLPVGELQISGTSTDTAATNCQVMVDVNDMKPFQKASATGSGGQNDYSSWSFKYTDAYHLITEGSNELTAKLSCSDKDIKPKWHSVNITGVGTKPGPYNVLFTNLMNNESSSTSLLSNNTQQGSPVEERKLNITSPQGANKTTDTPYPDVLDESTNATNELSIAEDQKLSAVKVNGTTPIDTPYPDVLDESTNATNELSMAEDQKLSAVKKVNGTTPSTDTLLMAEDQKPSAVKVKEDTTPTDTPYPDVLLEEETTTDTEEEQPGMQPLQQGLQDEKQQLSAAEDQKPSAAKIKEETTIDKEGAVKEAGEEQPEMKSPLQMFGIDNDRKVPANGQLQVGRLSDEQVGRIQDEKQQLSVTEDQKPSAAKIKEETTIDKEGAVKEAGEEQPEMKSPLQMFGIDNDRKVPANGQLQVGHRDVSTVDSAEYMYSKLMSSLE